MRGSARTERRWRSLGQRPLRPIVPVALALEERTLLTLAPVLNALVTYHDWVDYAPSYPSSGGAYNPNPTDAQMTADLTNLYEEGFRGVVTYSLQGTFADIPKIAKSVGFDWVIAGIWDPTNASEVAEADSPSVLPYTDAFVVGDEGLTDGRYTDAQLTTAMTEVKTATGKPVTTSEPGGAYYEPNGSSAPYAKELLGLGDWLFPDIDYFLWENQPSTPQEMWTNVSYVYQYMVANQKTAGPVVAKSIAFPSAGGADASSANQIAWYQDYAYADPGSSTPFYYVYFEAYDQPWKSSVDAFEPYMGLNGLNTSSGGSNPTPAVVALQPDIVSPYAGAVVPPFASAQGLTATEDTGVAFTANLATFHDPNDPAGAGEDRYSASVFWGDGTGFQKATATVSGSTISVDGSHEYAAPGVYTVQIDLQRASGFGEVVSTTVTVGTPPSVTTLTAGSVTAAGATLSAAVDPKGSATSYWFVYGTSPTLKSGTTMTASQSAGSAPTGAVVTTVVSGLAAQTTYYFEIVASNAFGTTKGAIESFTTAAATTSAGILMPSNTVSSASSVLYLGTAVPLKEITLTNDTSQTVYPILTDENSQPAPGGTESLYDPFDPLNQEYRGYIGYTSGGQNYLGLRPGQQITIAVPLVFWNAGRIQIASDGSNLIPATGAALNPFNYFATNPDGTSTARFAVPALGPAATQGVVMWYHAEIPEEPALDAPTQLAEMTFRDPYLATLPTAASIDPSQEQTLINYDVSYVDSMLVPVAMEAATVSGANAAPTDAVGWTGASLTLPQMQTAIQNFTSDNPASNGLGEYFGGNGYPSFELPDESVAGVKIPSGGNVIGLGPYYDVRSSYNSNTYMLSTGGTGDLQYFSGGTTNSTTVLKVQQASVLADLTPGMVVTSQGPTADLKAGTTIVQVNIAQGEVILSQPAIASATNNVYTFSRPVTDYATNAMENLWYSWADYYVANNQVPNVGNVAASIPVDSQVLTFAAPVTAKLVPGMEVTGPGIPAGTIVMSVASGGTSVDLSNLATGAETNALYSFESPRLIARSAEVEPSTLSFASQDQATANLFAQAVYAVMSAMSTIPVNPGAGTLSTQLLYNAIGCNVGQIPGILAGGNPAIAAELTVDVTSILRGVYNYESVPQSTGLWYPSPATPTAGALMNGTAADFGIYNLDPFVWFVHQELGLTGYGFSVDDGVADVGVNGANQLQITIGGLGGLSNSSAWSSGGTGSGNAIIAGSDGASGSLGSTNLVVKSSGQSISGQVSMGLAGAAGGGAARSLGLTTSAADDPDLSLDELTELLAFEIAGDGHARGREASGRSG
jgi:hypothetical protein